MADPNFAASIGLVVATAIATGGVSLAVAWQQNVFARRRDEADRKAADARHRREISREHALGVSRALASLHRMGAGVVESGGQKPPDNDSVQELYAVLREEYLLIADAKTRAVLADGLTVVVGGTTRKVKLSDWMTATDCSAFVVAAYLRGDPPPPKDLEMLAEIRSRYHRPGLDPEE